MYMLRAPFASGHAADSPGAPGQPEELRAGSGARLHLRASSIDPLLLPGNTRSTLSFGRSAISEMTAGNVQHGASLLAPFG